MDELREECGVFGVYASKEQNLASMTYYGLYALQHRGQDSCGIVVNDGGVFTAKKDLGLVGDVFTKEKLLSFGNGKIAVSGGTFFAPVAESFCAEGYVPTDNGDGTYTLIGS